MSRLNVLSSSQMCKRETFLKTATVVSAPKKHPPGSLENDNRPISLILRQQLAKAFEAIVLKWVDDVITVVWSAVAQLVECRTRNRESPGSNPRCYRFEVWAFSFTSRRLSRLSCIHEYLAIDSGGNVSE